MRLFIGLSLNPALRREAAAYAQEFSARMPGKYVPPENYHITLAFLGENDASRLPLIREAMREAAEGCSPFALSLREANYFGRQEHAILHLVPRKQEGMERAAAALRRALSARGIAYDPQPFNAHITLARNVNVSQSLTLPFPPLAEGRANGITLYHSTRVDGVLTYISIGFAAFGAP